MKSEICTERTVTLEDLICVTQTAEATLTFFHRTRHATQQEANVMDGYVECAGVHFILHHLHWKHVRRRSFWQ